MWAARACIVHYFAAYVTLQLQATGEGADSSCPLNTMRAFSHTLLNAIMQRHPSSFLCLVSADGLPEVEREAAAPTGEDVANGKRSRRTSVTGLKEAVEEAEQQAAKRVKAGAGSLEGPMPMAPGKLQL